MQTSSQALAVRRLFSTGCTHRYAQPVPNDRPANKAVFAIRRSGSRFGALLRAMSSFCQIRVVATSGYASELRGPQNVVLQQMEQDIMAQSHVTAENHSDQGAAARQTPKDLPSSARPSPQKRPPVSNDGLETLRSSDC
jgi:hypothetical protein